MYFRRPIEYLKKDQQQLLYYIILHVQYKIYIILRFLRFTFYVFQLIVFVKISNLYYLFVSITADYEIFLPKISSAISQVILYRSMRSRAIPPFTQLRKMESNPFLQAILFHWFRSCTISQQDCTTCLKVVQSHGNFVLLVTKWCNLTSKAAWNDVK